MTLFRRKLIHKRRRRFLVFHYKQVYFNVSFVLKFWEMPTLCDTSETQWIEDTGAGGTFHRNAG